MKAKKKSLVSDILNTLTKCFVVLVVVIVLIIAFSGIKIVKSGNVALVFRFGKLVGESYEEQVHEPGLLLAFPYIIDKVVMVPTGSVMEQTVTTHYTNGNMTTLRNNGYVITGDHNIAVVSASVKYVISDPVAYTLNVKDITSLINAFISSAMVEEAAKIGVDELLTSGKDAYSQAIIQKAQQKLSNMNAGVMLSVVELTNVSMPTEVKDLYDQVNSAAVNAATLIEKAELYRENLLPSAEAQKATAIANANTEKANAVSGANTALAEFWGVTEEYKTNPELVKTRIYNAKVAEAVAKIGKIYMVLDDGSKIVIGSGSTTK